MKKLTDAIKVWEVEYKHTDGRSGNVKVTTEIQKSAAFEYGNGKSGAITVGDYTRYYDLRYNTEKDLHIEMLRDYFGKGLRMATEI